MLTELRCSKFRPGIQKITFREGLNTVLGTEEGTNSAGKSTFLLILDFVFGGSDYSQKLKKLKEAWKYLEDQTIEFAFEFGGEKYYFSRSVKEPSIVTTCDSDYQPLEDGKMTLENYQKFLAKKYGLTEYGLTFRNAVGRFIRVDHRDTMNEEKPFKEATSEKDEDAITGIIKLYGQYEAVEIQQKTTKDAKERAKTYSSAVNFNYIKSPGSLSEYKENAARIDILAVETEELAKKSSEGLLDLKSEQSDRLREIQTELSDFRRQRVQLTARLESIKRSQDEIKKSFPKDYSDLQEFFPDVNVERLKTVDEFHRSLMKILRKQLKDSADDLEAMIALADEKIKQLEEEKKRISRIPNVAKEVLDRYSKLKGEMQMLQQANASYDEKDRVKQESKKQQESLDSLVVHTMNGILKPINDSMREMHQDLFGMNIVPPSISVQSASSYTLNHGGDNGLSSRYEGLLFFDLAVFQTGKIPFLIHDSNFYPTINDDVVEKLIRIYQDAAKGRQIFIAFDKTATPAAMEILKSTEVLHLGRGGESLYGRKFNETKSESL